MPKDYQLSRVSVEKQQLYLWYKTILSLSFFFSEKMNTFSMWFKYESDNIPNNGEPILANLSLLIIKLPIEFKIVLFQNFFQKTIHSSAASGNKLKIFKCCFTTIIFVEIDTLVFRFMKSKDAQVR